MKKFLIPLLSFAISLSVISSRPNVVRAEEKFLNLRGGWSDGWNYSVADYNKMLDDAERLHVGWLRMDVRWDRVHGNKAAERDWQFSDRIVEMATARGLKIIALPSYTPSWANGGALNGGGGNAHEAFPFGDDGREAWAEFVRAAAERYIPQGVTVWEIWNEPNMWSDATTVNYVNQILKPGSDAVRQVSREHKTPVTVLLASWAPLTGGSNQQNDPYVRALRDVYSNGGKDYFDAVAVHPYCFPLAPDDNKSSTIRWNHLLRVQRDLRPIMVNNGDEHKQIWATEFGYHTASGVPSQYVHEDTIAEYMPIAYDIWCGFGDWAGPMIWYSYLDSGTSDPNDDQQNFGLNRQPVAGSNPWAWQPKPALEVMGQVLSQVSQPLPPITSGWGDSPEDSFEDITAWTGDAKRTAIADGIMHVRYDLPGTKRIAKPWIDNRLLLKKTLDLSDRKAMSVDIFPIVQTPVGLDEPLVLLIKDKDGGVIIKQQIKHLTAGQWNTVNIDVSGISAERRCAVSEINFYIWTGHTAELNERTHVQYLFCNLRSVE